MIRIEIETDNAAFHDADGTFNPGPEAGRILVELARGFSRGGVGPEARDSGLLLDANGNTVGRWELVEDDDDPLGTWHGRNE